MWEIAYNLHFHLNNLKKLHQFSELRCQIGNAPVMLDFSFYFFFLAVCHILAPECLMKVWSTVTDNPKPNSHQSKHYTIYTFFFSSCFNATDREPVRIEYEEKQVTMKLLNLTEDNKVSFSANFWFSV